MADSTIVNVDEFLGNDKKPVAPVVPVVPPAPAPTPEPVKPSVSGTSTAEVQETIGLIMRVATGLAKVTGTQVDDKVVAFLAQFVNEPWFAEAVAYAMTQFEGKKVTQSDFKAVMATFKK